MGSQRTDGVITGFLLSAGVYVPINFPSDSLIQTQATGINPQGDIVGFYQDDSGIHAFLLRRGSYTSIDVPGAGLTIANDINARGDIVGRYNDADGRHGFVLRKGKVETIDFPDAVITEARGINPEGDIVGHYRLPGESIRGFLLERK